MSQIGSPTGGPTQLLSEDINDYMPFKVVSWPWKKKACSECETNFGLQ
jgi:hypothetical protein